MLSLSALVPQKLLICLTAFDPKFKGVCHPYAPFDAKALQKLFEVRF
jgi:hypothetical protein